MEQELKMPYLFSDHMVFQQNRPMRIWGSCRKGSQVRIRFGGETHEADGKEGAFFCALPPKPAGIGYDLEVSAGGERLWFSDVAVGEVWISAGQSNMEMPLSCTADGLFEAQFAGEAQIRFVTTPRRAKEGEVVWRWHFYPVRSEETPWQIAKGEGAGPLSAAAYYFAKRLADVRKVPVGIIDCNWGGTSIFNWVPVKELLENPLTAGITQENIKAVAQAAGPDYEKSAALTQEKMDAVCSQFHRGETVDLPPNPMGPACPTRYGGLYETMFRTVCPFMVRGTLWYQGESDAGGWEAAQRYIAAYRILADVWRRELDNPDMPIIATMLAGFEGEWIGKDTWNTFRDGQLKAQEETENTYLINLADKGERLNIHPFEKRTLGTRMAACALKECYGMDVKWEFPKFQKAELKETMLTLTFSNTYGFLTSDNAPLDGFEVKDGRGLWHRITGRAKGDTVVFDVSQVENPCGVRHNFVHFPEIHLFNHYGLPAYPFGEKEIIV